MLYLVTLTNQFWDDILTEPTETTQIMLYKVTPKVGIRFKTEAKLKIQEEIRAGRFHWFGHIISIMKIREIHIQKVNCE